MKGVRDGYPEFEGRVMMTCEGHPEDDSDSLYSIPVDSPLVGKCRGRIDPDEGDQCHNRWKLGDIILPRSGRLYSGVILQIFRNSFEGFSF